MLSMIGDHSSVQVADLVVGLQVCGIDKRTSSPICDYGTITYKMIIHDWYRVYAKGLC